MNMPHKLLSCIAFAASILGPIQACSDSSGNGVAHGGGSGAGGAASSEGGIAGRDEGGNANGGSGSSGKTSAGASGNAGEDGSGEDAGANGSAGAGGSAAGAACHISWTGAATGEADCSHLEVCHQNFLSLGVVALTPAALPLVSIQLIYSPTELTLGNFTAMDMDMVNCNVQTKDTSVTYAPSYDAGNHLAGGTSMTGTLTDLQFGTDPNDPCAGSAHGSFDVVLPQTTDSAKSLTLHAEF